MGIPATAKMYRHALFEAFVKLVMGARPQSGPLPPNGGPDAVARSDA